MTKSSFLRYTLRMHKALLIVCICLPFSAFARIPTPNQIATQQQANALGTYTSGAGSWGYGATDPYLAGQGYAPSRSYMQYGQMQRSQNMLSIGVSLLDVFTSKGSFGDKVKFLMMDQLKRRVKDPLEATLSSAAQNLTLQQLYQLSNPSGQNTYAQAGNPAYSQCVGCINQNQNSWQPTYQNPHSVQNAFTQFTNGSNNSTSPSNGGGLGVVTPVQ